MRMICIKKMNAIGSLISQITPGRIYDVIQVPIPLARGQSLRRPDNPIVIVRCDDNNWYGDQYPMVAFSTIDDWRENQLESLGI